VVEDEGEVMRVLDLFSGIGGFSLGLERAGMKTVAFCEIEPFCRLVLAKHWPKVPIYNDIRELTAERLVRDDISVDVICGGFPCQDISLAGKGAGLAGTRSGLWFEYARIIGEVRPRFVIVENVAALLGRGLSRVLGDLAALGYDAEWHCIPASAVGAPHRRDRLWIVGLPNGNGRPAGQSTGAAVGYRHTPVAAGRNGSALADAFGERLEGRPVFAKDLAYKLATTERGGETFSDSESIRCAQGQQDTRGRSERMSSNEWSRSSGRSWWLIEPDVGRVAHGVPARVDRLRGLGNAVVPQIPEIIGRAIMASVQ